MSACAVMDANQGAGYEQGEEDLYIAHQRLFNQGFSKSALYASIPSCVGFPCTYHSNTHGPVVEAKALDEEDANIASQHKRDGRADYENVPDSLKLRTAVWNRHDDGFSRFRLL